MTVAELIVRLVSLDVDQRKAVVRFETAVFGGKSALVDVAAVYYERDPCGDEVAAHPAVVLSR